MSHMPTRRRLLGVLGLAGTAALAGCVDGLGGDVGGASGGPATTGPPTRESPLYQPWSHETVRAAVVDGGTG